MLIKYDDTKVLSGQGLDDEDDLTDTLQSIESAEKTLGKKMDAPEVFKQVSMIRETGSRVENMMQGNSRISLAMIEEGNKDKSEEVSKAMIAAKPIAEVQRQILAEKVEAKAAAAVAFDQAAAHFQDDLEEEE